MKVAHIITSLGVGGAEMMLINLLAATDVSRYQPHVISLVDEGELGAKIQAMDVPLWSLNMKPSLPNPLKIRQLRRQLQHIKPDVIQTWMYHANLIGGLAARRAGRIPVAWSIHSGHIQRGQEKRTTIWLQRISASLSRWLPHRVVYVSKLAQSIHESMGYQADKSTFIPNGFDLNRFHPDPADRQAVRAALSIPDDASVIGYVARFHPLKGHRNFIQAAGKIHVQRPDVQFVLAGTDINQHNVELQRWIDAAGIQPAVHLLGRRDDVPRLLRAFDMFALASDSEAFPMALGEAMATGLPAVVTDVGDSAYLLGQGGLSVPLGDVDAFAQACLTILADAKTYGEHARQRIADEFSLRFIADRYMALYDHMLLADKAEIV
jgi:glycosyltransferase involved in cell wall biosynthesis